LRNDRRNIFWRNTKASIGDEYNIPEIVEQLIFLEPSDVELVRTACAVHTLDSLQTSAPTHTPLSLSLSLRIWQGMYEDAKRNHDTLRMRQLCW
jgi:hypothetical protein